MLCGHASIAAEQVDLADKGRAAAVVCGVRTTTGDGAPVAYSEYTTFALGAGPTRSLTALEYFYE